MTDSSVTQCPHCRTSFRVSRAQLAAAHGAVRCGACMQVFNAAQHLLSSAPAAATSAPAATAVPTPAPVDVPVASPTPAASTEARGETLWIHDDLDLDALNLDEELARLEEQEQQLSRDFLNLRPAPAPHRQLLEQQDPQPEPLDESWTEQLLNPSAPAPRVRQRTEPSLDLNAPPAPDEAPAAAADTAIYAELDAEPDPAEDGLHPDFINTEQDNSLQITAGESLTEPAPDVAATTPELTPIQPLRLLDEPALRHETLRNLSEEPLHLAWQQPKKPWGRWIAWGLLNLTAIAALAGQYGAYHFEELARQDRYRPWFEQLCPEIGCTLPSKVDVTQIKSSNLVVRSHPDFSGALVVDAILYNRATFSQPFPLLELRFADSNGQLLASRRFKAGEYLSGELAGRAEMPPQTPIHISLDILDPGVKAVNTSLSFFSPE